MYIKWDKPSLDQQVKHIKLNLSLYVPYSNFEALYVIVT